MRAALGFCCASRSPETTGTAPSKKTAGGDNDEDAGEGPAAAAERGPLPPLSPRTTLQLPPQTGSASSPPPSAVYGCSSEMSDSEEDGQEEGDPGEQCQAEVYRISAAELSMSTELELRELEAEVRCASLALDTELPVCPSAERFALDLDIVLSSIQSSAEQDTSAEQPTTSTQGRQPVPAEEESSRAEGTTHVLECAAEDSPPAESDGMDTSVDFSAVSALLRQDSADSAQPLSPCTESDLHPFRAMTIQKSPRGQMGGAPPPFSSAGDGEPEVADVSFLSESSCDHISDLAFAIPATAQHDPSPVEAEPDHRLAGGEATAATEEYPVWPLGLLAAALHKKRQTSDPEAGLMSNVLVALMANLHMHHLGTPCCLFLNQLSAIQHLADLVSLDLTGEEADHTFDDSSASSFTACQIRKNPLYSGRTAPSAQGALPDISAARLSCASSEQPQDRPKVFASATDGDRSTATPQAAPSAADERPVDAKCSSERAGRPTRGQAARQPAHSGSSAAPLPGFQVECLPQLDPWGGAAEALAMEAAAQAVLQAHARSASRLPTQPSQRAVAESPAARATPVSDWELASRRLESSLDHKLEPFALEAADHWTTATDSSSMIGRIDPDGCGAASDFSVPSRVPKRKSLREDLMSLMDFIQDELERVEGLEVSQDFSQQLYDAQKLEADESFCQDLLVGATGVRSDPAPFFGPSKSDDSRWAAAHCLDGLRAGSSTPLTDSIMETFACRLSDTVPTSNPSGYTALHARQAGAADHYAQPNEMISDCWLGAEHGIISGFLEPHSPECGLSGLVGYGSHSMDERPPPLSLRDRYQVLSTQARPEQVPLRFSDCDNLGSSGTAAASSAFVGGPQHGVGDGRVSSLASAMSGTAAYEAQLQKLEDSTLELRKYLDNLRHRSRSSLT